MTPIKIEIEDGTYISQIFFEDGSVTTSANIGLTLFKEDGTSLNVTSRTPKTLTSDYKTIKALANSIGLTEYAGKTIKGAMLVKGTTAPTVYEQFIPNMPSPEYPSRIRNVGDNVNIFDINNLYNYINAGATNEIIDDTIRVIAKMNTNSNCMSGFRVMDLTKYAGQTITITAIAKPSSNSNAFFVVRQSSETYDANTKSNEKISLVSKAGENVNLVMQYTVSNTITNENRYLYIGLYACRDIITQIDSYTDYKIKIEQGTKATPYTPFGYGSADIKVQNGNIFNKSNDMTQINTHENNSTITKEKDKITIVCNSNSFAGFYLLKDEISSYIDNYDNDKKYYISADIETNKSANIKFGFENNATIATAINGKVRITAKSGTLPSAFVLYGDKDNLTILVSNIQVCEVENYDYTKHEEQTVHFPLAKPLHKNDYLADDGIHHKRKTIVFDGMENWYQDNVDKIFYLQKEAYNHKTNSVCMCNHYEWYANLSNKDYGITTGVNWFVQIKNIDYSTLDNFKTYLSEQYANGTPVTVEYELAEEEIEEYTAEQQEAYNKLKQLYSYEDVTHITCENDITCNFNVEHFKDYNILRQNDKQELQAQIDEIKASLTSEVSE